MNLRTIVGCVLISLTFPAVADENDCSDYACWACNVLMCMLNPNGPTDEPSCQPPMDRLYRHLEKGHSFPHCKEASSKEHGVNDAKLVTNYFDQCPAGLTMIQEGSPPVHQGDNQDPGSPRLCAGQRTGTHSDCSPGDGGCYDIPIYEPLLSLSAYTFGSAIDVYMNSAFFTRVHWQDNNMHHDCPECRGVPVKPGTCVGYVACAR